MQRSGLAVAVLALLLEAPMHPYRMQRLIKERGKHLVVNVGQRSQLYKTIDRLLEAGLIRVSQVERDTARPERTDYAITDDGRRTVVDWTTGMLAAPRRDFPEFTAGLAYLAVLSRDGVITALESRLRSVREEITGIEGDTASVPGLPRVFLVENEYLLAHLRLDETWIAALLDDLRDGRLDWDTAQLIDLARRFRTDREEFR